MRTAFQFVSSTPDSGEGPEKAIPSLASELRQTSTTSDFWSGASGPEKMTSAVAANALSKPAPLGR